jgi:hypothetical protein
MNMSLRSFRPVGFSLWVLLCVVLILASLSASAQEESAGSDGGVELNPQHPESYTVQRGDTLWDISAMFLRDPWFWPEIWQVNPQVENPHLIYPGDILTLVYIDGEPRIQIQRRAQETTESGDDERLSPQIRREDMDQAIRTIPFELIGPFLSKGSVLSLEDIEGLPYIAAIREGHLVAAQGNDVYVRGDIKNVNKGFTVIKIGDPLIDPDDLQIVGYRGIFVGEGIIRKVGDPSTLRLVKTQREAQEGDRLLSQDFEIPMQFTPRAPEKPTEGQIIDVLGGVTVIGQYQVVVLNRGLNHGIDAGNVFTIWQTGQPARDRFSGVGSGELITLPDEEAGTLMVFKSYDRISYALVMEALAEIHILDKIRNPM